MAKKRVVVQLGSCLPLPKIGDQPRKPVQDTSHQVAGRISSLDGHQPGLHIRGEIYFPCQKTQGQVSPPLCAQWKLAHLFIDDEQEQTSNT